MSLLITGGIGFVLNHVVKLWLEDDPSTRVIVVDNARIDWEAKRFLSNVEGRIQHIVAAVCRFAVRKPQRLTSTRCLIYITA